MRERLMLDVPARVITDISTAGVDADVHAWLEAQANAHGLTWLLAHADDGVIWGIMDGKTLHISHGLAPLKREVSPPLREKTLQAARLFAGHGELLLWRDDETWRVRLISEQLAGGTLREAFDEPYMLWGTYGTPIDERFVLMEDGQEGLRHLVPEPRAAGTHGSERPLRLWTRHYMHTDEAGMVRVAVSRLAGLDSGGGSHGTAAATR